MYQSTEDFSASPTSVGTGIQETRQPEANRPLIHLAVGGDDPTLLGTVQGSCIDGGWHTYPTNGAQTGSDDKYEGSRSHAKEACPLRICRAFAWLNVGMRLGLTG